MLCPVELQAQLSFLEPVRDAHDDDSANDEPSGV